MGWFCVDCVGILLFGGGAFDGSESWADVLKSVSVKEAGLLSGEEFVVIGGISERSGDIL